MYTPTSMATRRKVEVAEVIITVALELATVPFLLFVCSGGLCVAYESPSAASMKKVNINFVSDSTECAVAKL